MNTITRYNLYSSIFVVGILMFIVGGMIGLAYLTRIDRSSLYPRIPESEEEKKQEKRK